MAKPVALLPSRTDMRVKKLALHVGARVERDGNMQGKDGDAVFLKTQ